MIHSDLLCIFSVCIFIEMEQVILEDRNYEPKKEDFIDKIPETIPEGNFDFLNKNNLNIFFF